MHCDNMKILISAQVDGELNDLEKTNLMLHLNECTECRTEHKNVLEFKQLLEKMKGLANSKSVS